MWYVIHTMSGLEQKCMQQCQEYIDEAVYHEMFIPMYKTKKHFKKEWHEVEKPLFPGYLFVDTDEIEPIMTGLKQFRQYTKLLKDGDVISPVKKEEQDFLALMMDKNHIVQYSEGFLIGDEVYITSGPLRKIPGWIKSVDRHRRTAKMEIPILDGARRSKWDWEPLRVSAKKNFNKWFQTLLKSRKIRKQSIPTRWRCCQAHSRA